VSSQPERSRSNLRARLAPLLLALLALVIPAPKLAAEIGSAGSQPPVLAYYYIWYEESSWDRAKSDFPLLGRYSSDDRAVMEQHVTWAKRAGIDGFIVSWKSTEKLDRRLAQLRDIAAEHDFKLAIIYQGLDFNRKSLPVSRITADLDYFVQTYADDPVFDIFGAPLVIWSGTWEFTAGEVASVTAVHRSDLLMLASEKNARGYERLAQWVDGDAYYWSSVDPSTYPDYQGKLDGMSAAVHEHDGLWIAPAAVGFDGRLVGGTRVVDRAGGENLRIQMNAATQSSADAIGLISWNEFSENSQVEPSVEYGDASLSVLATIRHAQPPDIGDLSGPMPEPGAEPPAGIDVEKVIALALLVAVIGLGVVAVARRRRSEVRVRDK
jgi:hypothetical protein